MYILKITHVLLLLLPLLLLLVLSLLWSSPLYESQLTEQRDLLYHQRLGSDPCQCQNIFLLTRRCHTSCPLQLLSEVLRQETNLFLLLLVLSLLFPLSVLQSVCVCVCVCVFSCLFFNISRAPHCRKYTKLWSIY